MRALINKKTIFIISLFFGTSIVFFISMIWKNNLPVLNLLILATTGLGVLTIWSVLIFNYFKYEVAIVTKCNEMTHREITDAIQETQYKKGIGLREKEAEFDKVNEILKLLVELRKGEDKKSAQPMLEDVKMLKKYLENHKDLLNQITEIVKPK